MTPNYTITSDFDGTLFDPNLKAFIAWYYNSQTTRLLNKHDIPFILNTGRPIWDAFSDVQIAMVGMKKPDVVVYGAGTKVAWRKNNKYELDQIWEEKMRATQWDKAKILKSIDPILKEHKAALFDTRNEYMTRVWIHKIPVVKLDAFIKLLLVEATDTKILRTEQILLPNTEDVFSGYLLLIPAIAGKEAGMNHVLNVLKPKTNLVFGDALVDLSMLTDKFSEGFAVNPTALARKELKNKKVTILEGSPPANILNTVKTALAEKKSGRNSPYRSLSKPFIAALERLTNKDLTPDQISLSGLKLMQKALDLSRQNNPLHFGGVVWLVIKANLMDIIDGERARRHPELMSSDGQLIDVYADRMKEYLQLSSRSHYDAAISCFLPSIARAQAEALGNVVPELDPAGGSAISRNLKLIKSYFLYSLGMRDGSNRIDKSIYLSNMQTFQNRKEYSKSFSWSKLKTYDKESVKRLLFLMDLLKEQLSKGKVQDQNLKEALKEYL